MQGLILACKYSCNCQKAVIFGLFKNLKQFIDAPANPKLIAKNLSILESYKFYREIAKKNKIRDPFDTRVVSSYWRGEPKLKGNIRHNYTTLIPLLKMPIELIDTDMLNECFVHPAKIILKKGDQLIVRYLPIVKDKNKLRLSRRHATKKIINIFKNKTDIHEYLTTHFSSAIENITDTEADRLMKISEHALNQFNRAKTKL